MRFSALQRRVVRCEQVLAVRMADTQDSWGLLSEVWRKGWSPLRILIAGVSSGFVVGKLEIPGKVDGVRWVQMIGSVSNLVATGQAAIASLIAAHAAGTADDAATQADRAADKAEGAMPPQAPPRHAAPPPPASRPPPHRSPAAVARADQEGPRPAEAATELSER